MTLQHSKRWFSNLLQGGLLAMLLVAASYVTIGRILIGNIDSYRDTIEERLTEQLGITVQIGELSGGWTYLNPSISIKHLNIGDEKAIALDEASVAIDTIASLRERTLIVRELHASGVRFEFVKEAGGWKIRGMPAAKSAIDIQPLLKSLDYLVGLSIDDVNVQVLGDRTQFLIQSDESASGEFQRVGEMLSVALPLTLTGDQGAKPFLLGGQFFGDVGAKDSHGDLYLKLPKVNAIDFVPDSLLGDLRLEAVSLGGELWLSLTGGKFKLTGKTSLDLHIPGTDETLVSSQTFVSQGRHDGEIVARISRIDAELSGVNWQLEDIGLSFEPGPLGDQLSIQVEQLEIGNLLKTVAELGAVGIGIDARQVNTIRSLNPQGRLKSLLAIVRFSESLDFKLVSELDSISVQRFEAFPVISDLNGMVQIGPKGGFLDMVNEDPFSLQFPNLFDETWLFDSAKTRVTYKITDSGIHAQTGLVEAKWGELLANGRINLKLPGDPLETTWGLELGVQHANLLDAFRYLPNTLKADVRQWLSQSILAGRSHESGMVFHGSLAKQAAKDQKAHQLYFEVTDTILDYDPLWPRFDELVATIFIDNFEISSDDATGRLFDSEVFDSKVMVPVSSAGVADTILIDGSLRGGFLDGIRLLNETPLFDATSRMAQGWQGSGQMQGTAQLNIPMGERAERGEDVWVNIDLELSDAALEIPHFDLAFSSINGSFNYETQTALHSDGFTSVVFGELATGKVMSDGDETGGEIVVQLNGGVSAPDLFRWSNQPLLSRASGLLDYETKLHVFYGNRQQELIFVEANSNLLGVALALPKPLGKTSDEESSLTYKQIFGEDHYRVELDLGEEVKARLKVVGDSLAGGRLHFGHDPLGVVSFNKLNVTGELAHVIYEEWDSLSLDLEALSEGSLSEELEQTLDEIEVMIGLFDVFGFEMDNVLTRITRDPNYWQVGLTNEWLDGFVSVSDDPIAPLEINMRRLAFESTSVDVDDDPLGQVSPSDFTSAIFSVDELLLDGEDYGSWAFLYEPGDNDAVLSDLNIKVKGLEVSEDASVYWQFRDGAHHSQFEGTVLIPDLGFALEEWGYASSIEGLDFTMYGDVNWPGSPTMVDLDIIDGLIRLIRGEGRFVQADNNVGALRLLGIFDFASLARRFRLDFSDVVKSGFSFSKIEGETRFSAGVVDVVDPILIEGSSSTFKVGGRVNLESQELDSDMIVTLPVNRNLPWYAAYSAFATGPLTGAGVFLAQKLFQNQINAISSAKYKITGTMDEPVIEFVSIFSDTVREAPEQSSVDPSGGAEQQESESDKQDMSIEVGSGS